VSGSTIGGVIGGVIGAWFGAPQVGWMIGSAIGGYVDPDVIKGPRLKDAQVQTSMEGAPRAIVYGKAVVAGNIIQTGPLIETKHKERTGKGGPVQETYNYSRSYAIRVCEGPIAGIARIWRDDKLVYDARDPNVPEDGMSAADWAASINAVTADTATFGDKLTIYLGDETQEPDPTLEGLPAANGGGMGNVPAHRGTAYVVIANDDLTDRQGTVPQYRFEVVAGGTAANTTTIRYVAPDYSRFVNASFPLANADTDYDFVEASGDPASGSGYSATGSTIAEIQGNVPGTAYPGWGLPSVYLGCMAGGAGPYSSSAVFMEGHGATTDLTNYQEAWLVYNWVTPSVIHDNLHLRGGDGSSDSLPPPATAGSWHGDALGVVYRTYGTHDTTLRSFPYSLEGFTPLAIRVHTKQLVPTDTLAAGEFFLPDNPDYVSDANGNVRKWGGTATLVSGSFKTLALESVSGVVYTQREIGPVLPAGDADDNATFWNAAYAAAVAAGTMPAGMTYSSSGSGGPTTYPRNKTSAYQLSITTHTTVSATYITVADAVTDLCKRVGIPTDRLEVSQLTDTVRGAVIGQQMACSDALSLFRNGYFFDLPEWGDYPDTFTKLRGIKRGGPAVIDLTDDDFVASDDDQDTRAQPVEFPRKFNLISADPTKNYEPTKHTSERRTDNVKAVGEKTLELALSQTADERAQTADKILKITWTEALGRWERVLPDQYSTLVASDPFTHAGKRWRVDRVELGDGTVKIEALRDRISAYDSNAVGNTSNPPTIPPSAIKGPTVFAAMNLPQLRTQDNSPGMYIAVRGALAGWPGCQLYLSTDGGLTDSLVATILTPSTMGTLTASVTSSGEPISVEVGTDTLESVTDAQIAARANAFAILSGGVAEVGQFQTATAAGDGFNLTDTTRGELDTTAASHASGDTFVVLDDTVTFLPLDVNLAGKTLIFRPVTLGTAKANNATYSVVFQPMFTSAPTIEFLETELGQALTTDPDGDYIQLDMA
jgi:hypothetical protein